MAPRMYTLFAFLALNLIVLMPFLIHNISIFCGASDVNLIAELNFELLEKKRLCFYEDVQYDGTYSFEYKIMQPKDGQYSAIVDLESPSGNKEYSGYRRMADEVKFFVFFPGTYSFCFTGQQPTTANNTNQTTPVFAQLRLRIVDGGQEWKTQQQQIQQKRAQESEQVELENALIANITSRINGSIEQVLGYQTVFRRNEEIGSKAAIQLGKHVMWWSIVQAIVIVITGFGQVIAMKLFFTDRREMTVIAVDIGQQKMGPISLGQLPIRP